MQPASRAVRPGAVSASNCISVSSVSKPVQSPANSSNSSSGRVHVTGLRQQPSPTTYHVPMGPAAVAAMTVTKSAVAAPIIRNPGSTAVTITGSLSPGNTRAHTPVFLPRSPVWQKPQPGVPPTTGTRPAIALTVSRIDPGQKQQTVGTVSQVPEKMFSKAPGTSLTGSVGATRVPVTASALAPQQQSFLRAPLAGTDRGKMSIPSISIPVSLPATLPVTLSVTVSPQNMQGVVLGTHPPGVRPTSALPVKGGVCQTVRPPGSPVAQHPSRSTTMCSTAVKVPSAPGTASVQAVSVTPIQPTQPTVTITTTNSVLWNTATVTSTRPQTSIPVARVCPQPLTQTTASPFIHTAARPQTGAGTTTSSSSHPSYSYYYSSQPFQIQNDQPQHSSFFAIRPNAKPAPGAIIHTGAASASFSINPMVVVEPRAPAPSQSPFRQHDQGLKVDVNADMIQDQQQNKNSHSPRPSILRKRDTDGVKKQVVPFPSLMIGGGAGSPPSPPGDGSSGGSTTVSANSSPGVLNENSIGAEDSIPMLVKVENNHTPTTSVEISPRKKPRKQQLQNKELDESESPEALSKTPIKIKEEIKEEVDHQEDGPVGYFPKRPHMSLLSGVRTLKGRLNHFQRYSDIRIKDDKPLSVSDLASQKHVLSKVNGWKIHHLSAQLEDLVDLESQVVERLSNFLNCVENDSRGPTKDINRVSELIKANLQRSKLLKDQVGEAKIQMMRVFEHKEQVVEIVQKYASKRSLKRREK